MHINDQNRLRVPTRETSRTAGDRRCHQRQIFYLHLYSTENLIWHFLDIVQLQWCPEPSHRVLRVFRMATEARYLDPHVTIAPLNCSEGIIKLSDVRFPVVCPGNRLLIPIHCHRISAQDPVRRDELIAPKLLRSPQPGNRLRLIVIVANIFLELLTVEPLNRENTTGNTTEVIRLLHVILIVHFQSDALFLVVHKQKELRSGGGPVRIHSFWHDASLHRLPPQRHLDKRVRRSQPCLDHLPQIRHVCCDEVSGLQNVNSQDTNGPLKLKVQRIQCHGNVHRRGDIDVLPIRQHCHVHHAVTTDLHQHRLEQWSHSTKNPITFEFDGKLGTVFEKHLQSSKIWRRVRQGPQNKGNLAHKTNGRNSKRSDRGPHADFCGRTELQVSLQAKTRLFAPICNSKMFRSKMRAASPNLEAHRQGIIQILAQTPKPKRSRHTKCLQSLSEIRF
mmetsp:Transcript_102054/g.233765  ORF Transcript_102054/g.233765 Transcript_102054/m.233765 type:complete len:447 (+) Transcript_102054:922-2262(+)